MKKWIISTVVISLLAVAAVVFAGPGPCAGGGPDQPGRGKGGGGPLALLHDPALAKELGVTDEQLTQVRDSVYAHRKAAIQLRADRQLAQLELHKLMAADAPDEAAVLAAVEQAGKISIDLRKAQVQEMLKVKSILGPEVVAKLRENVANRAAEMRDRWMERGGPGRGRGPDGRRGGPGSGFGPGGEQSLHEGPEAFMGDEQAMQDEGVDPMDFSDDTFVQAGDF